MNGDKAIALTFEAGGDPVVCGQMLDVLRAAGTPATIFLAGSWSDQYPELVRRMADDGHEFGNHSYTHPDLTQVSDDDVHQELYRTDEAVTRLAARRAFPWFRPPYDAVDARVSRIAREEGYRLIQRNAVDGGHWNGETTPESVLSRTLDNAYDGAVITYHLDSPKTLAVLAQVIERLREAGYRLVCLSELPTVSERPERHPDFVTLDIDPGYMQVFKRGARAWSMNVLEFGARANCPTDSPIRLVENMGTGAAALWTGTSAGDWQPAADHDRHLLVLAGEVECTFRARGDPAVLIRVVGRPGDFVLWSQDYELRTEAHEHWLALIFE